MNDQVETNDTFFPSRVRSLICHQVGTRRVTDVTVSRFRYTGETFSGILRQTRPQRLVAVFASVISFNRLTDYQKYISNLPSGPKPENAIRFLSLSLAFFAATPLVRIRTEARSMVAEP